MFVNLYNLSGRAFVALGDLKQKLERGDSDSAGSTLRTIAIVTLVLVVVGLVGSAVVTGANTATGNINQPVTFPQ